MNAIRSGMALALLAGAVGAQSLLVDIETTPALSASSNPTHFASDGSLCLFRAQSAAGDELWKTDGTAAGTELVLDLSPGPFSSFPTDITFIRPGVALLLAQTGPSSRPTASRGPELWRSDGTAGGTWRIPTPGLEPVSIGAVRSGGVVVFRDPLAGSYELYASDGSVKGTVLIQSWSDLDQPPTLFSGDRLAYLHLRSKTPAAGLWSTDGTRAGTGFVQSAGLLREAATRGDDLFYATPSDLFMVDGATGAQVFLGKGDSIHVSGETCFYRIRSFPGVSAIYRTEGSVASKRRIGAFTQPGSTKSGKVLPIGGLGDELVFQGNGETLFVTDTPNQRIVDLGGLSKVEFGRTGVAVNGSLVFGANFNGVPALWGTDGTPQGTGVLALQARYVDRLNTSTAIFQGFDANGAEPWVSDGSVGGTKLLADLAPHTPGATMPSRPAMRGRIVDAAIFSTSTPGRLWRTDGTASGTRSILDLSLSFPDAFTFADEWFLFFRLMLNHPKTLQTWVSDGTPAGTRELNLAGGAYVQGLGASLDGERIVFAAGPAGQGTDPWISDGTDAGTSRIVDLYPSERSYVTSMAGADGRVVFVTERAASVTLYGTDGSAAGTELIGEWQDVSPYAAVVQPLLAHADRVFFGAGPSNDRAVFVTDGNASGTIRLPFATAAEVLSGELVGVGAGVVFSTFDPAARTRMYHTDGTVAGTRFLLELNDVPQFVAPIDDEHFLYLSGAGELWSVDTNDGNRVFAGQLPASYATRSPRLFAQESGATRLVFSVTSADTSMHELWSTDGTLAGTGPLSVPWQTILSPAYPHIASLRIGSQVLYAADDGVHGLEVHTAPVSFFDDYVAETYGRGCGNEPVISLAGEARASSAADFDIVASQATPGAAAVLGWSFDRGSFVNASGCTYALGGMVHLLVTATDANGEASIAFTPSPALIDLAVDFQYGVFEADGSVSLSKGLEVVVGP